MDAFGTIKGNKMNNEIEWLVGVDHDELLKLRFDRKFRFLYILDTIHQVIGKLKKNCMKNIQKKQGHLL